jgi:outer membrane protein TolC
VNPTVRTAGLRIMEARRQLGIAGSTRYPQVQQVTSDLLGVGSQRAGGPDSSEATFSAAGQIAWELDFWGKYRRSIESADAAYSASIAHYDDVQVLMAAQVAGFYASIRTTEARLRIARENSELQKRSLDITVLLFKGGNDSELDVQQAKAQYLGTLATIPSAGDHPASDTERVEHIAGQAPGPFARDGGRQGADPAGRAGRHRRHAGRSAAPPAGRQDRGNADGRAVRPDRRQRGGPLSVDLAAGIVGPVGHLAQRVVTGAELGFRAQPDLERVRPWPAHQHVLVQDARFQQLYEQYQDAVLRAAREVDDAAVALPAPRSRSRCS